MADIQAASELIDWTVKGVTILLMIVAASMAIKKKNNLALGLAIVGNLAVYYFTQSPLLCWGVSIACIIWAGLTKSPEQKAETGSSKSQDSGKSNVKIGNIIGLILGILFVAGPLIGYLRQEASLSDPTTQGVLILFAVIGGFMIINNLFKLFERDATTTAEKVTATQQPSKAKAETRAEDNKNRVRCRFCKKLYNSEYNGCPYCKKK